MKVQDMGVFMINNFDIELDAFQKEQAMTLYKLILLRAHYEKLAIEACRSLYADNLTEYNEKIFNIKLDINKILFSIDMSPHETKVKEELQAAWKMWAGWKGNHDQRIEDATCTNCGFKHATVHSLERLAKTCPGCKAAMTTKEVR